jgi:hypothetical protein
MLKEKSAGAHAAAIVFRTMDEANRGGAFTTIDGALDARGEGIKDLFRAFRDGLDLVVYSAGDDFFVNVSEFRLARDLIDQKRDVRLQAQSREAV